MYLVSTIAKCSFDIVLLILAQQVGFKLIIRAAVYHSTFEHTAFKSNRGIGVMQIQAMVQEIKH